MVLMIFLKMLLRYLSLKMIKRTANFLMILQFEKNLFRGYPKKQKIVK